MCLARTWPHEHPNSADWNTRHVYCTTPNVVWRESRPVFHWGAAGEGKSAASLISLAYLYYFWQEWRNFDQWLDNWSVDNPVPCCEVPASTAMARRDSVLLCRFRSPVPMCVTLNIASLLNLCISVWRTCCCSACRKSPSFWLRSLRSQGRREVIVSPATGFSASGEVSSRGTSSSQDQGRLEICSYRDS